LAKHTTLGLWPNNLFSLGFSWIGYFYWQTEELTQNDQNSLDYTSEQKLVRSAPFYTWIRFLKQWSHKDA
jgi:predicted negative regulator of RcsB-dependent stress response